MAGRASRENRDNKDKGARRAKRAKRAKRALPNARHLSLPGCGHVPMSDDPDQVSAVLLQGSAA